MFSQYLLLGKNIIFVTKSQITFYANITKYVENNKVNIVKYWYAGKIKKLFFVFIFQKT